MITAHRGDELGEAHRRRLAEIFTHGFADDFRFFSRHPAVLARAFEHMLLLDRFHVACVDGGPAALATLTTGDEVVLAPRWRELRRHLGPVRGAILFRVVRTWFNAPTPDLAEGTAEIGFVTTDPRYQGQGVATVLLRHLLALPGYRAFVLEDIKSTNHAALALYRKLGFAEYKRRPERFARSAGFDAYVSMRRDAD